MQNLRPFLFVLFRFQTHSYTHTHPKWNITNVLCSKFVLHVKHEPYKLRKQSGKRFINLFLYIYSKGWNEEQTIKTEKLGASKNSNWFLLMKSEKFKQWHFITISFCSVFLINESLWNSSSCWLMRRLTVWRQLKQSKFRMRCNQMLLKCSGVKKFQVAGANHAWSGEKIGFSWCKAMATSRWIHIVARWIRIRTCIWILSLILIFILIHRCVVSNFWNENFRFTMT